MTKRYICIGRYIWSRHDGDRHYISARRVAELYKVNPDECYFDDTEQNHTDVLRGFARRGELKVLYPRSSGDYELEDVWKQKED